MKRAQSIWLWTALVAGAAIGGCARPEPMNRVVKSESAEQFQSWREKQEIDLPAEVRTDFDTAVQEIKLAAMEEGAVSSTIREAKARAAIDGKSVREVLLYGWQSRRGRLERERKDLQTRFDHDSKLTARVDQEDRAQSLATTTRNEQAIIEKNTGLIADVDKKLALWRGKSAGVD